MKKLAILGESDGLLLGYEDVKALPDEMPDNRVDGGDGDLEPRTYRWDAGAQAFMPLKGTMYRDGLLSFVFGIEVIRRVGDDTLPAELIARLKRRYGTIDAIG